MKEESHEEKHTHGRRSHSKKETVTVSKSAVWMIFTFIFAILFIVALFTGGFRAGRSQSSLSNEEISSRVVDSINLIQAGLNPTVSSVERMPDGIYKIEVEVQGQKLNGYISPDGKMFFPQGFTTGAASASGNAPAVNQQPIEPLANAVPAAPGCGI